MNLKPPFEYMGDAAHWGASDLYPGFSNKLLRALRINHGWQTGWHGVKKEIESLRIALLLEGDRGGPGIVCEVSVSNDFDEAGYGRVVIGRATDLGAVKNALADACELAYKDQADNSVVELWCIHATVDGRCTSWVETYLADRTGKLTRPPGDNGFRWGFQGEADDTQLPSGTRRQIEERIRSGQAGVYRVGSYVVWLADNRGVGR